MSTLTYMPRLDGLRAAAVGLVLIGHFMPIAMVERIGAGAIGVKLFFVLSGYLITRILIGLRDTPVGEAAFSFYWRRLLRLSPPYYAAIAVAAMLGISGMQDTWWIHALYLSNFQIASVGHWIGAPSHFWSLAVEEQFYLLWFFVVVSLPRRYLLPAIVGFLILGPAYRGALYVAGFSNIPNILLPGAIDSLALGALLAVGQHSECSDRVKAWVAWFLDGRLLIAAIVGLVAVALAFEWTDLTKRVAYPVLINVASACLIAMGSRNDHRPYVNWLEWAPLRHIGKISYGIYVYHNFVPFVMTKYVPAVLHLPGAARFVIYTVISLALAQASWSLLEKPVLKLKDREKAVAGFFRRRRRNVVVQAAAPEAGTATSQQI